MNTEVVVDVDDSKADELAIEIFAEMREKNKPSYAKKVKAAMSRLYLSKLDRVKLLLGYVPSKSGLIYDQIAFPSLSVKQIEKLSDLAGGYNLPPSLRRQAMQAFLKNIYSGVLRVPEFRKGIDF